MLIQHRYDQATTHTTMRSLNSSNVKIRIPNTTCGHQKMPMVKIQLVRLSCTPPWSRVPKEEQAATKTERANFQLFAKTYTTDASDWTHLLLLHEWWRVALGIPLGVDSYDIIFMQKDLAVLSNLKTLRDETPKSVFRLDKTAKCSCMLYKPNDQITYGGRSRFRCTKSKLNVNKKACEVALARMFTLSQNGYGN